jgi:drug/metabolite transporter (DMT)-like permease
MGLTVEKVSVSVATVANKMSLIIPVVISLIYLRKGPDNFSHLNYTGIFFALIAIILTSYRKAEQKNENRKYLFFLLPFSIFFLGGLIDTLINYTNYAFLQGKHPFLFPLVMFTIAAATGIIILAIKLISKREIPRLKDVAGGFALGIPNYFSLYFLLRTLSDFKNDGAVVFPVVNIGIIVVASLAAVLIFKEKLSGLNLIGICLSAVSIILIFW